MGPILLYAVAAAVYPQLLAVVVVILTRPRPQPLLWTCYLASLIVSVGSGIAILAVFRSRGTIAGTSSQRVGPAVYLVLGAVALLLAVVMLRRLRRQPAGAEAASAEGEREGRQRRPSAHARMTGRLEDTLGEGSLVVATVAGVLLALPGPFDFIAVGHLARGGYATFTAVVVVVAFALVKFILIEVPIAGYAVDPDGTAARVGRFSRWMHANRRAAGVAVVAVVGVVLVGRGVTGLG